MQFCGTSQQAEMHTKLSVQRFGIVADNFKSAALGRPFESEGADDHIAAVLDRAANLANVDNRSFVGAPKSVIL
jgi:hypothetical protein